MIKKSILTISILAASTALSANNDQPFIQKTIESIKEFFGYKPAPVVVEVVEPTLCERLRVCEAASYLKEHKLESAIVACVLGGTVYYVYKNRRALFGRNEA